MWGRDETGKEIVSLYLFIYIYIFAFYNFCTWQMHHSFHKMSLSPRSQGASWVEFSLSGACDWSTPSIMTELIS